MTEYKNSSAVLVFNSKGELALQLRAANDDSFPSHWDFSAGGGIDPEEDGKISAERELREELGVATDVEFVAEEHHTYLAWKPGVMREVDLLYIRPITTDRLGQIRQKLRTYNFSGLKKLKR